MTPTKAMTKITATEMPAIIAVLSPSSSLSELSVVIKLKIYSSLEFVLEELVFVEGAKVWVSIEELVVVAGFKEDKASAV